MDSNLKIAIVEDNDDLRALLMQDLCMAGYFVQGVESAEQLDEIFSINHFDVLIADVNLPGESGFAIAKRYKRLNSHLTVVMLTARTSTEDKVRGYESGADLYLTKPVSNIELLAVVGSISRHISAQNAAPEVKLNLKNLTLTGTKTVDLNKQEVAIVKALSEPQSSNLPYYQLLEICNEPVDETAKAGFEVRITRLRKKFVEIGVDKSLRALRGNGYQLLVNVHIVL
ncbi:response regulator transcription factor [Polynucleobacter necessarius]|uniref:response regulator transcription factor n=1 Tax=Polynucleobacter necessarius TaxID=576610 RepID=UPI000E09E079|nr:response regulator transcription factor [Polynucleobacter necessarius]